MANLAQDQLDLHEHHVRAYLHFSDPDDVATVCAKHMVLSDDALRHHQRREVNLWAFDGDMRACVWPHHSRDTRIAGAIVDAVLGKGIAGIDAAQREAPRGISESLQNRIAEVPRLAAIIDVSDAAVDLVEVLLDAAGLTAREREAARMRIVAQLTANDASAIAGCGLRSHEQATARARRKLRRLGAPSRVAQEDCRAA